MQVQHLFTSRTLMQVVDVLRDQGELRNESRHCCNSLVRGVRPRVGHRRAPPFVPGPYQCGIALEGMRRCELGGIEALPKAGLLVAESRNTAFGGHAGAGEYHEGGRLRAKRREGVDRSVLPTDQSASGEGRT